MPKLFQNKSLLKSIQIFLVCLVVLGGVEWNNNVEAAGYVIDPSQCKPNGEDVIECCDNRTAGKPAGVVFDWAFWAGGDCHGSDCIGRFIPKGKATAKCRYKNPPPTCDFFTATPSLISPSGSSNLKWETTSATSVSIPDVTSTAPDDDEDVYPAATTEYTLTATNADGETDTCEVTVTVCNPVCDNDGDCDLGNGCTVETCNNPSTCSASCSSSAITACVPGDNCCPGGCNNPPDTDCECKKGLVPCGRSCDVDSTTGYKENDPCTLCHLILMMQLIMDFLFKIAAVVAALFIAASGTMYIFATGRPEMLSLAKTTFKLTILGFTLIFIAWILVNTILTMFGYIDPLENNEWHIMC